MAGASMSGAKAGSSKKERQTQVKKNTEDIMRKYSFTTKNKKTRDTNLRPVNMIQVKERMFGGTPRMAKRTMKNGIVQAAAFPPTMQCTELILECEKHYSP